MYLGSHSGTHIDAPRHLIDDGRTIDQIPINQLAGVCRVLDCTDVTGAITRKHLAGRLQGEERVLLKTNSSGRTTYQPDYTHLGRSGADLLVHHHIACVGIDSPSIEAPEGTGEIHRRLLQAGTVIIELLDLSGVAPGQYWMAALPLRLEGLDGSPARVILSDSIPDGEPDDSSG
jgi:arylformamidase